MIVLDRRDANLALLKGKTIIPLVKTHEYDNDNSPAIYVIRDGRPASVSLYNFWNRQLPLEEIIEGRHRFGTWQDHVNQWNPLERANTLLLHYEDMVENLPDVLSNISQFLERDIINYSIPHRNTISGVDGKWVKKKSSWRSELSGDLLKQFNQTNRDTLTKFGYT